jgi:hypothetical protein
LVDAYSVKHGSKGNGKGNGKHHDKKLLIFYSLVGRFFSSSMRRRRSKRRYSHLANDKILGTKWRPTQGTCSGAGSHMSYHALNVKDSIFAVAV